MLVFKQLEIIIVLWIAVLKIFMIHLSVSQNITVILVCVNYCNNLKINEPCSTYFIIFIFIILNETTT